LDLGKAYDIHNHKLMLKILEQYAPPPKFQDSIKRLYTNLKVIVEIGREKAEIDQEVGVRQGDNVSSVIFLFLMSAFTETLEKEWKLSNLPEEIFKNVTNKSKGQLTGHLKGSAQRRLDLIIHQILYINSRAFFFEMSEDAMLGLDLINKVFAKLGLKMHIGRGEELSKTEIMYVPKASFYHSPRTTTLLKRHQPKIPP
jgi:hypothetical protein